MERNAVNNTQYHRWELIEESHVPALTSDKELEENISKFFSKQVTKLFQMTFKDAIV